MIKVLPVEHYGYDFIPPALLSKGRDEYWLRNAQQQQGKTWRKLVPDEIAILALNGNFCSNWDNFLVSDPFNPVLIRGSTFYGLIRLGAMRNTVLEYHDFCIPAGIRNSMIISCDIGDDVAIENCAFISHYIIGDGCILSRIDEMQTTNHAKFGNGAVKEGEDEDVRVWIDVMNEAGGRSILPFEGMIAADAFLWAAYRDDTALMDKLKNITQEGFGGPRGSYGTVGSGSVIKSCAIIKDVAIGCNTYIKGANKLKNLTILSSESEQSQIGEGVELVNGIVGYGSNVFYGSKAVRFVIGRNCNLKYGARLIHSVLGDNSTVSCCEILNNLIFPVHEQHHNNSFLIASLVQGMSNMAAAATLGSNHNSRANDGEIRAKRGFWPGLAVTLKHSCCFASYTIIAKGDYPAELNISLPFSLVNNNVHRDRLEVMPAYFWIYNLYALERNSWKSANRDRRKIKIQHIETDYLAPDTAEEILAAIYLLEGWLDEAGILRETAANKEPDVLPCRNMEKGKRTQVIIKPFRSVMAYRQMLHWYAAKTIAAFFDSRPELDYAGLEALLGAGNPGQRITDWVNCGGQIVPAFRVDELRADIVRGKYGNWEDIHGVYTQWLNAYPLDSARHAWAILCLLHDGKASVSSGLLKQEFTTAAETSRWISNQVLETKAKDHRNQFRKATFRNDAEMEQVLGKPEDNSFVRHSHKEATRFGELIARVIARL